MQRGADGAVVVAHLAVAAQPVGVHRHSGDHCLMPAHGGTELAHGGHAGAQHGDVGGGAADVGDDGVAEPGEMGRAHQAGGRPGENGLDGSLAHELGRHERTVAAHHHHGGIDTSFGEGAGGGGHQVVDDGDEPRVQHRRDRTFRPVQLGRQIVAHAHCLASAFADERCGSEFVGRVAHAELGRHGVGVDAFVDRIDPGSESGEVEQRTFAAVRIVPTGQHQGGVAGQCLGQSGAGQHLIVEADDHRANGAAAPFHQRIGGQRGGQRHQFDAVGVHLGMCQRGIDGAADADRQIVMGGGGLGRGHDGVARLVVHHGIGERATRVDTEQQGGGGGRGHGMSIRAGNRVRLASQV